MYWYTRMHHYPPAYQYRHCALLDRRHSFGIIMKVFNYLQQRKGTFSFKFLLKGLFVWYSLAHSENQLYFCSFAGSSSMHLLTYDSCGCNNRFPMVHSTKPNSYHFIPGIKSRIPTKFNQILMILRRILIISSNCAFENLESSFLAIAFKWGIFDTYSGVYSFSLITFFCKFHELFLFFLHMEGYI